MTRLRTEYLRAIAIFVVSAAAATLARAGEEGYSAKTVSVAESRKEATFKNGPATSGAVSLTFDDGPHGKLTPRLLETLKKENAKATFFLLGVQVELFPEIAKAVAEAGFEVGNHSWSHRDMTKMGEEQIREEVRKTQDAIERATGVRPKLFRPPYGNINDRVYSVLREEGLDVVLWSIDPRDWASGQTSASVTSKIVKEARPGAIVCIHDIHARTVDAMPELLPKLREMGLAFATAGELIEQERAARVERAKNGGSEPTGSTAGPAGEEPLRPKLVPLSKSGMRR